MGSTYGKKWSRLYLLAWVPMLILVVVLAGCGTMKKTTQGLRQYAGLRQKPVGEETLLRPRSAFDRAEEVAQQEARQVAREAEQEGEPAFTRVGYREAVGRLAEKVLGAVPKVDGVVVSVSSPGRLILDVVQEQPLVRGTVMRLYQRGEEFRHPLTGKILGYLETEVGRVELVELRETYSVARVIGLEPGVQVKPGDVVRILEGRPSLAVLPAVDRSRGDVEVGTVTDMLTEELVRSGRFELFDPDELRIWMLESGVEPGVALEEPHWSRLRSFAGSDFFLVTSLSIVGDAPVLESRLFRKEGAEPVTTARVLVKAEMMAAAEPPTAEAREGWREEEELPQTETLQARPRGGDDARVGVRRIPGGFQGEDVWTSQKFPYEIVGMDVGDVDGDGKQELVAATETGIYVYRLGGDRFEEILSYTGPPNANHLAVDMADINGNGVEEIYVTALFEEKLLSYVIESRNGRMVVLKDDINKFLRVLDLPGQQPMLIAQDKGTNQAFQGKIKEYVWKGNKLKRQRSNLDFKELPQSVEVFGTNMGDLDADGEVDVIHLDSEDRLALYDRKGEQKWRGSERYGGYPNRFYFGEEMPESIGPTEAGMGAGGNVAQFMEEVRGRILLADIDEDGLLDAIIPKNIPSVARVVRGLTGYGDGQIVGLSWNGITLAEAWRTKKLGGLAADVALADVDNDGQVELMAAAVLSGGALERKAESIFYVFEFR